MSSTQEEKKKFTTVKNCVSCKKEIHNARKNKIYCSEYCRFKAWSLLHPRTKII